jgi:WD40 repeat protein
MLGETNETICHSEFFKQLHLSRLIKENHGETIRACKFYTSSTADPNEPFNLIATIGSNQANIYDNQHLGNHLDIVSQFNIDSEHDFTCCCWVSVEADALLVLGSTDFKIHILSLARSKEIMVLQGHLGVSKLI